VREAKVASEPEALIAFSVEAELGQGSRENSLKPLTPTQPLSEQVYAVILNAICDGALRPGERLTQDEVASRLKVSRQPVTGALAVLKTQGFVIDTGRRGVSVAPVDPGLFEAIYQLRSAVEPLAVRLATPHLTTRNVARGRDLLAQGKRALQAGTPKAVLQADMDFHAFIYDLSRNPLIVSTMRLNWNHLRRGMRDVLRMPGQLRQVWREHAEILEAMIDGDAGKAAALMQTHIQGASKRVLAQLAAANADDGQK